MITAYPDDWKDWKKASKKLRLIGGISAFVRYASNKLIVEMKK